MSWRKLLFAGATVAIVATAFAPTEASAHWRGHRGYGYSGAAIGLGLGLGLAGAGYYGGGYGYAPYGYYGGGYPAYGYGGGCWRRTVVYTPYGPRTRRIWICG